MHSWQHLFDNFSNSKWLFVLTQNRRHSEGPLISTLLGSEFVAQGPGGLVILGPETTYFLGSHFRFEWVCLFKNLYVWSHNGVSHWHFISPSSLCQSSVSLPFCNFPFLRLTRLYLSLSPSHSSISLSFSVSLVCICISRYLSFSFCRLFMRLLVAMFTAWNAQPWLAE